MVMTPILMIQNWVEACRSGLIWEPSAAMTVTSGTGGGGVTASRFEIVGGYTGGLYGTIWILALAFIARFMPDTVKALSTSFLQIHRELEEAAWVCGKGVLGTIRTIVLPLASPGVLAAMTLLFVLAIRELGSSLFLYTSNTMVMSVLLLDYYEGGNLGKTAAFSLVQTVLLGVLIGGANWLSRGAAHATRRSSGNGRGRCTPTRPRTSYSAGSTRWSSTKSGPRRSSSA